MATFTGGVKLQARLAELSKKLERKATVTAGFHAGSQEADGTSLPMIAAVQEFGAPRVGIPPRPYMRPTVAKHSSEWGDMLAKALPAADYDVVQVLNALGEQIASEIQQSIHDVSSPPLKPQTVKRKGFDTPLIDTATMIQAVRSEVQEQ